MVVTHHNTVALRLSEPHGSEGLHARTAGPSSTPHPPSASESPVFDTLLQTAPVSVRGWFQSWISSVPVSRYRTLPSHVVLQLLYALRALSRCVPAAHLQTRGQGGSASRPSSTTFSRAGLTQAEDATTVLNRLLISGTQGADIDKFWIALGEMHEDDFAQRVAAAEHPSTPDDFSRPVDDVFNTMLAGASIGDPYPILQAQGSQAMYQSNIFIPPSRVGSVGPGQREYSDVSLLPPAPRSAMPEASHFPSSHPGHWTAAGTWDTAPSSWATPGDASSMMVPERMDQQMWEASQGNPPYGWGNRDLRY